MTNKIQLFLIILIAANLLFLDYKFFIGGKDTNSQNTGNSSYLPTSTENTAPTADGTSNFIVSEEDATEIIDDLSVLGPNNDSFKYDGKEMEAYWVPSQCADGSKTSPTVLVFPQHRGLGQFEREKADRLAEDCFNIFALNWYDKSVEIKTRKDAQRESGKFKQDTDLLVKTIGAAIDHLKTKDRFDPNKIGIIGYSFGGWAALEYICNAPQKISGIVGFYSSAKTSCDESKLSNIETNVQLHMGAADPYVDKEHVADFKEKAKNADLALDYNEYAGAGNSFALEAAGDDMTHGIAYNKKADVTSWEKTLQFFNAVFK